MPLTPEEEAAFRARMGGGGRTAGQVLTDIGNSAGRIAENPIFAAMNPLAYGARQATDAFTTRRGPQLSDLSARTQEALRAPQAPTELQPMHAETPDAQPVATLSSQGSPARPASAGGPGAGSTTYAEWRKARGAQLGDYETDKALAGQLGADKAGRIEAVAQLQQIDAAKKQRDAEIQQQHEDEAAAKHQQFLDRNTELADDIGRQKIDTKRLASSLSTGQKINNVLGSVLGGFSAGFSGNGQNEFVKRFDNKVAQDIQAQINEQDNKKASLSARNSVFGQMLAETGDRRIAAMQTRNLMYEAAKQDLMAKADQLGIPEVRTNAEQAVSALQHQQDQLNAQLKGEDYQRQVQAAQAQAQAQRAAEEKAWQRQKDILELGLKKDALEVERIKAGKDAGKEDNAAIQETTKRLADDDIVKNKDLVDSLARKIDPKTGDVVGLGKFESFRNKLASSPGLMSIPGVGLLGAGVSDETRLANQEFEQLKLLYQTKVTGSGGSDAQMAAIDKAFRGAGTMTEKRRAILMAKADLECREGLAMANLNDGQKATLAQRLGREGQTAMPGSVRVKDSGNLSDERSKQFKRKLSGY